MSKMNSPCCLSIVGLLLAASGKLGAAPTPEEILKKAGDVIKNAKTYQASIQMTMNQGPAGSMTMQFNVKTVGWKKTWAKIGMTAPGGQGQQNPMMTMFNNVEIVDDGTSSWTYVPAMKQYSKGPTGSSSQMFQSMLDRSTADATLKLVGTQNVSGRPTYVIEATPKRSSPNIQDSKTVFYVDQATYHIQQVTSSGTLAARGNRPAQQGSGTVVFRNQKFNEPIPDSIFKFTPPAGAKASQGGMGFPFGGMSAGRSPRH